ncbi:hypothetical protein L2E82_33621 [Cichorium intybus]|uniref:Uncharacterized protein n=1 Tax=Cichorium intybus TaxID=13427 RepID=A0ACB9BKN1_CICIN|nr:hypothetical protein L2E82_33621 [Cichorium intybus]
MLIHLLQLRFHLHCENATSADLVSKNLFSSKVNRRMVKAPTQRAFLGNYFDLVLTIFNKELTATSASPFGYRVPFFSSSLQTPISFGVGPVGFVSSTVFVNLKSHR